jgi:hypothetical protein
MPPPSDSSYIDREIDMYGDGEDGEGGDQIVEKKNDDKDLGTGCYGDEEEEGEGGWSDYDAEEDEYKVMDIEAPKLDKKKSSYCMEKK